jgi:hypothetical protein
MSFTTRLAATFAATALSLMPLAAAAVNKCIGPDGRVVFQDAPCAGKGETITVRPASGAAPGQPAGAAQGARQTEAQRIEANVAASQKERRLRDLTQREVPAADAAIESHLLACQDEQRRIESGKFAYVQNLYGKTHAAQVAAEQAAAASRCDTKDRELRAQAQRVRKQCTDLGGCG